MVRNPPGLQRILHSQAQRAALQFTSHAMGLVLLITVLDKYRSKGVSGVSQRLEKEGLKTGLEGLIVQAGLPINDVCTDQCHGGTGRHQACAREAAGSEDAQALAGAHASVGGAAARQLVGVRPKYIQLGRWGCALYVCVHACKPFSVGNPTACTTGTGTGR